MGKEGWRETHYHVHFASYQRNGKGYCTALHITGSCTLQSPSLPPYHCVRGAPAPLLLHASCCFHSHPSLCKDHQGEHQPTLVSCSSPHAIHRKESKESRRHEALVTGHKFSSSASSTNLPVPRNLCPALPRLLLGAPSWQCLKHHSLVKTKT